MFGCYFDFEKFVGPCAFWIIGKMRFEVVVPEFGLGRKSYRVEASEFAGCNCSSNDFDGRHLSNCYWLIKSQLRYYFALGALSAVFESGLQKSCLWRLWPKHPWATDFGGFGSKCSNLTTHCGRCAFAGCSCSHRHSLCLADTLTVIACSQPCRCQYCSDCSCGDFSELNLPSFGHSWAYLWILNVAIAFFGLNPYCY